MHRQAGGSRGGAFDAKGDDVSIDQHGEVGGDDLQQMLEARSLQHRERGFVHAALADEVAAAQSDQAFVLVLQPAEIMAQAFEHEMLEIEHPIAGRPARRTQQVQRVGMAFKEIRMVAQIGDDIGGAGGARLSRLQDSPAERLWLVLRTVGHR